jgi:type IV pilus assembly protein PilW
MNTKHLSLCMRRAQLGVTVVELMVALLLGVILTGGAVQVFVSNRATYAFNEGFARLQENGRFALDTLSYHARLAGYLGCLPNVTRYNNLNTPTSLAFNFDEGLRGYEAVGTNPGQTFAAAATDPANSSTAGDWSPALPAALVGSVIPGSDVLVIRHASPTSHALLSPFTSATKVTAVADAGDYARGDIAIVSDCQKASIFQITGIANTAGGIEISHVAAGTPGNLAPSWNTDQEYASGAQLLRGETWVFYVGARPGGGPPALFQRRLLIDDATTSATLVAEELVEAAETMQVRYGIDAALDGAIDSYVTANNVTDWGQVAAVRIAIVTRSPDEYGTDVDNDTYVVDETIFNPVDDRRLRQVFITTTGIRNRLP